MQREPILRRAAGVTVHAITLLRTFDAAVMFSMGRSFVAILRTLLPLTFPTAIACTIHCCGWEAPAEYHWLHLHDSDGGPAPFELFFLLFPCCSFFFFFFILCVYLFYVCLYIVFCSPEFR